MRQFIQRFSVETHGKGLTDITKPVVKLVGTSGLTMGIATVYIRHTSASLTIQENADPDVQADLAIFFEKIAPEGRGLYLHELEGPDDMPAHIRAVLSQTSISIPIETGRLVLGTWQGLYLFEHRREAHRREIVLHIIGE